MDGIASPEIPLRILINVFVRSVLVDHNGSSPDTAQAADQTKSKERYEGYIEALVRRLAKGHTLAKEISQDMDRGVFGSASASS
jgi:hypothetical protein